MRFSWILLAGDGEPTGDLLSMLPMLISLVLLGVVFYFFLIRPESKRKKAAAKMLSELIVGDEVTTIGGIVGKVVSIKDDAVVIESGPERTRVKAMRWAIKSKGQLIEDK